MRYEHLYPSGESLRLSSTIRRAGGKTRCRPGSEHPHHFARAFCGYEHVTHGARQCQFAEVPSSQRIAGGEDDRVVGVTGRPQTDFNMGWVGKQPEAAAPVVGDFYSDHRPGARRQVGRDVPGQAPQHDAGIKMMWSQV
jgi:hypothetical protein